VQEYYDRRAPEYDDWYLGAGLFAQRDRPGWADELERLAQALGALPPGNTLDAACGTGFLTRHLRGEVVGLEQDEARQGRTLNDGSRWVVYKRWFTTEGLASELGGGATIFDGNWFVAVRSP
jgi:SAM-dependent methyltransferase